MALGAAADMHNASSAHPQRERVEDVLGRGYERLPAVLFALRQIDFEQPQDLTQVCVSSNYAVAAHFCDIVDADRV